MTMYSLVADEEEAAFDALVGDIADYINGQAEKQSSREIKRALQVVADNVRAGLFMEQAK